MKLKRYNSTDPGEKKSNVFLRENTIFNIDSIFLLKKDSLHILYPLQVSKLIINSRLDYTIIVQVSNVLVKMISYYKILFKQVSKKLVSFM